MSNNFRLYIILLHYYFTVYYFINIGFKSVLYILIVLGIYNKINEGKKIHIGLFKV